VIGRAVVRLVLPVNCCNKTFDHYFGGRYLIVCWQNHPALCPIGSHSDAIKFPARLLRHLVCCLCHSECSGGVASGVY